MTAPYDPFYLDWLKFHLEAMPDPPPLNKLTWYVARDFLCKELERSARRAGRPPLPADVLDRGVDKVLAEAPHKPFKTVVDGRLSYRNVRYYRHGLAVRDVYWG